VDMSYRRHRSMHKATHHAITPCQRIRSKNMRQQVHYLTHASDKCLTQLRVRGKPVFDDPHNSQLQNHRLHWMPQWSPRQVRSISGSWRGLLGSSQQAHKTEDQPSGSEGSLADAPAAGATAVDHQEQLWHLSELQPCSSKRQPELLD